MVQPGEQNVFDQRHVEFALWDAHALPVLRSRPALPRPASRAPRAARA